MKLKADSPDLKIEQVKQKLKIESISLDELKTIVNDVILNNINLLKEKDTRAVGPLMGEVMKQIRGKIDGKIVSEELKKAISIKLKELK